MRRRFVRLSGAFRIHLDDPEVGAILDELVPRRGDLEPESAANE